MSVRQFAPPIRKSQISLAVKGAATFRRPAKTLFWSGHAKPLAVPTVAMSVQHR